MGTLDLALATLAVTPSGALSPGPLTAATLALGARGGWRAGIRVAAGHTAVELPYVTLLCLAFERVRALLEGVAGDLMTAAAAAAVSYFAYLLLSSCLKGVELRAGPASAGAPLAVGAVLTGLNAFFLLWWVSVGFELVSGAARLGAVGLAVMYASHVWVDYAWLAAVAEAGARGASALGGLGYRLFLGALGVLLLAFGLDMVLTRFLGRALLPF